MNLKRQTPPDPWWETVLVWLIAAGMFLGMVLIAISPAVILVLLTLFLLRLFGVI